MRLIAVLLLSSLSFAQGMGGKSGIGGKAGFGGGASAASAPAVFQTAGTCTTNAATTCNAILGGALTAGHRLLVAELTTGATSTPTMTGETFTAFTGASGCLNNTGDVLQCWLVASAVGGQTTVTCSSSATNVMCIVIDITAPVGNSPKDAGGNSQTASGTSLTVSTSATTTNSNDLVIGCFGSDGAGATDTYSVGSPYISVANISIGGGNAGQMMCERNTPGSTGVQTATASLGVAARSAQFVIAIAP